MRAHVNIFYLKKAALLAAVVGLAACSRVPEAASVNPAQGTGSDLSFEAKYDDAKGADNLTQTGLLVNDSLTGANGCYVIYVPRSRRLVLVRDAGKGSLPIQSSNPRSVENSQCILNAAGWAVTRKGNDLTMKATVSFKPAFAGRKNIYLYAANKQGGQVLRQKGTWLVP